MKVLMIAPTPFFADRGAHVQIYEQMVALESLGHEVLLVTYGLGKTPKNINLKRCWNPFWYSKLSAGPSLTKVILLPVLAIKVLKVFREFGPDVVHAHLHEGALIAKGISLVHRTTPIFFDYQGSLSKEVIQHTGMKSGGLFGRALIGLERIINSWFPIITQSESMRYEIGELSSMRWKVKRIVNVKDGVNTDRFHPRDFPEDLARDLAIDVHVRRIIFMGYLSDYQGFQLLLEAVNLLVRDVPNLLLIVIGYPIEDRYLDFVSDYNLKKHVKFLGKVDYFEVHKYLALGEIAIAPKISETEGDGKIYNYMAMGLPIVAFSRPVSREILGDCGIYAETITAESLCNAIFVALRSGHEKGSLARDRALRDLQWLHVAERIVEAYSGKFE